MDSKRPGRVENYTGMALGMGFVNLLWIMTALWAWAGLMPVLLLGLALNHLITLIDLRVTASRNRYAPRPKAGSPAGPDVRRIGR